ncbi:MAG: VOC family protein [Acidimicrobiales bacterium]
MLRLRQIAFVAADLAAAETELAGPFGLQLCFRDPGVGEFGLENGLFTVGDQFLEIVSPTTEGTTAGRLLERRGGDAGYMVLVQVDTLDGVAERLDAAGMRIVYDARGEGIRGLHVHPRDIGGAIVSIDATDDPAAWGWASTEWPNRDASGEAVDAITGVTIGVADPAATAARWAEAFGAPSPAGTDAPTVLALDDAEIRFVDEAAGAGLSGLELRAADRSRAGERHHILGVDITLV